VKSFQGYWFYSLVLVALNWDSITSTDLFQTVFHDSQTKRMHREWQERRDKISALDKQQCAIELKSELSTMEIEIQRDILFGMDGAGVKKRAMRQYQIDSQLCESLGISPYIRQVQE